MNEKTHPYDKFREQVKAAIDVKLDEFRLLEYDHVTADEFWNFLLAKKWRKPKEDIHLYQIVNDILSVNISDFVNYATVEQMQTADLFSPENADELKELLK